MANLYDEEDFVKEFIELYNTQAENKIGDYWRKDPPEPDFLVGLTDGSKVYIEVTQVYAYQGDVAPHNHRLIDFCAALQGRLDEYLPHDHGKIVVTLSAHLNKLPSPKIKKWESLLKVCQDAIVGNSTQPQVSFFNKSMPQGLEVFNMLSIHYMPKSLRSVLVIPNTYEAYWEEERVGDFHFRIDDKNGKSYELKDADKVWLLVRDREGFQTIATSLQANKVKVVTNKFDRVFLQEEYDPQTQTYPYLELPATHTRTT